MKKWWVAPTHAVGEASFLRSSLPLMFGTVSSQAIVFLLSPVLSRLFTPADFGDLANYNAWVSILGLVSNLRYEHALIVARNRMEMNRVMALAVTLSLVSFGVFSVAVIALYVANYDWGYLREIRGVLLFIPLGIIPAVVASLLMLFSTRRGRFRRLAVIAVVQVAATVAFQLGLGAMRVPRSLVVGALLGSTVACLTLVVWHLRGNRLAHVSREMVWARMRETAREHANFPRFSLAADTINVVVQQFVPVLLTALFSPVTAGLFAFSTRVVRVPLFVVSTAVSTVLRKRAGDELRRGGSLTRLCARTAVALALLAIAPFYVLWMFSARTFAAVFGHEWIEAGQVVRILSPGIMLEFIALPLFVFFVVTSRQRYTLRIQLLNVGLLLTALLLGRFIWGSFIVTCVFMSAALIVANLVTILAAFYATRPASLAAAPAALQ